MADVAPPRPRPQAELPANRITGTTGSGLSEKPSGSSSGCPRSLKPSGRQRRRAEARDAVPGLDGLLGRGPAALFRDLAEIEGRLLSNSGSSPTPFRDRRKYWMGDHLPDPAREAATCPAHCARSGRRGPSVTMATPPLVRHTAERFCRAVARPGIGLPPLFRATCVASSTAPPPRAGRHGGAPTCRDTSAPGANARGRRRSPLGCGSLRRATSLGQCKLRGRPAARGGKSPSLAAEQVVRRLHQHLRRAVRPVHRPLRPGRGTARRPRFVVQVAPGVPARALPSWGFFDGDEAVARQGRALRRGVAMTFDLPGVGRAHLGGRAARTRSRRSRGDERPLTDFTSTSRRPALLR